jgi:protein-arginine kinase activator protein McsA
MGSNKTKEVGKNINNAVESTNKAKEAIDNLKIQLKQHLEQAEYNKTMATKAQGALEVLLQLHPEENEEN